MVIILFFTLFSFGLSESELTQDRLDAIKKILDESKNYAPDFSLKDQTDSLYVLIL